MARRAEATREAAAVAARLVAGDAGEESDERQWRSNQPIEAGLMPPAGAGCKGAQAIRRDAWAGAGRRLDPPGATPNAFALRNMNLLMN